MTITAHSFDIALVAGFRNSRSPLGDPVTPPTGDTDLSVLRAFPGAEGSGALSVGGRSGTVIYVTNLNDSGEGSLRSAVEATGPRVVVFRVSGTIVFLSNLRVRNSYLTVAGQTAPGGGIQIAQKEPGTIPSGASTPVGQFHTAPPIILSARHVTVQYVAIRPGYVGTESLGKNGCLAVYSPGTNIIDHCSLYWSYDENLAVWSFGSGGVQNLTVQDSIVAETFVGHATPITIGASSSAGNLNNLGIDFIRNIIATGTHRMPRTNGAETRVINNIIYNRAGAGTQAVEGAHVDYIGNLWVNGPLAVGSSHRHEVSVEYRLDLCGIDSTRTIKRDPSIYTSGNFGPYNSTDQFEMVKYSNCVNNSGGIIGTLPAEFRRALSLNERGVAPNVIPYTELESSLTQHVGSSMRLNNNGQMELRRDACDQRFISDYLLRTGPSSLQSHEDGYGGFPTIESGAAYTCTAGDGIADGWKTANGLDPATRYNAGPGGAAQVGPVISDAVFGSTNPGWTYLDLFLAGQNLPGV